MLNHIDIQGRLTDDPELRHTGNGTAVASFTLACERDYKQDGKREVDFVPCVAWRNTGEFVSNYFRKGDMMAVSGRLQIRKYTDKTGNQRSIAEIIVDSAYFCGGKRTAESEFTDLPDDSGDLPF